MTRLRREDCPYANSVSSWTAAKSPGHKVGFHGEWLNMRQVVWIQDPAVMGSFITVSRTGTEGRGWMESNLHNREREREREKIGGVHDQQSLRTGSELICLLSMEIWALMNRTAEPVLIWDQVSTHTDMNVLISLKIGETWLTCILVFLADTC